MYSVLCRQAKQHELHNLFTLGIGLESMTPLLKKEEQEEIVPTIDVTADSVVA